MSESINCIEENSNIDRGSILYLVVPCYNEEEVIITSSQKNERQMQRLVNNGFISPKAR